MLLCACHPSKFVPEGKYLLKKNKIIISGDKSLSEDLNNIVKQKENFRTLGLRFNLWAYNQIDSSKVAKKRLIKNQKISSINQTRRTRQERINKKRIDKARRKGQEYYTEKIIPLKDTIEPRSFFGEWLKYSLGEHPVIFDSSYMNKTMDQFDIFLRKKGYYDANCSSKVTYKKEAIVHYYVNTGKVFLIDSFHVKCNNRNIKANVDQYIKSINKKNKEHPILYKPFNIFYLDELRSLIAKKLRDSGYFGYSASNISYLVDTSEVNKSVRLEINVKSQYVEKVNEIEIKKEYKIYPISKVIFNLCDTNHLKEEFRSYVNKKNISINNSDESQFINTGEIIRYAKLPFDSKKRKQENLSKQELDPKRKVYIKYNGTKPSVKPEILELQNYLEETNVYKEYYVERSYRSLIQLGVFNNIKPVLSRNSNNDSLIVNYYLKPAKKQSFSFEPRLKHSNGLLGVAASVNYSNKNIFRSAEKMTLSFGGGFEAQPAVFDSVLNRRIRTLNTFEFGPSLTLEIPGLFPSPATMLSKRQKPKTIIDFAFNIQKRDEFDRQIFQINYEWEFIESKYQIFSFGLPLLSSIKFVNFNLADSFALTIYSLNDPFLSNTYSNQLIWEDIRFGYEMNNQNKDEIDRKIHDAIYFSSDIDFAGNTLWMLRKNQMIDPVSGQKTVFGIGYSQFFKINNNFIHSHKINPKNSIHSRVQIGFGVPYGNSSTSLPYDYSFFAGGSNDNRGWNARSLGPGAYKYYLDENATATQIGDVHIGTSVEYRLKLNSLFQTTLFADAGNIWTNKYDENRPGGEFSKNWYKQIAVALGTGIRLDLDFFVIRFDIGVPFYNPALPDQSRWIFQSRDNYYNEGVSFLSNVNSIEEAKNKMSKPFRPSIHFGLGFPF